MPAAPPNPSHTPRDTCYFDGQCGFCRRTTRALQRLDWLNRLDFQDLTAIPESELPVPLETALRGMPMRTARGRTLVGLPAIRRALFLTPVGFIPACLLYVPGISHLAAVGYDAFARRRARDCNLPTLPRGRVP